MKKVLVIDDDELHRALVINSLETEGFDTIEIDDVSVAPTVAQNYQPDLIISGVRTDGRTRFTLQELLRDNPQTSSIPLILMTEKSQQADDWESDPEIGYLTKPFDVLELVSAVARHLNPNLRA